MQDLTSFRLVRYKNWFIKASSKDGLVCVVMIHAKDARVVIRYFDNEHEAASFIEFWAQNFST